MLKSFRAPGSGLRAPGSGLRAPGAAVVLDVDGTLVDTSYQHTVAWATAFGRVGLHPPLWRVHRAIGAGGDPMVAGDDAEREHGDVVRDAWVQVYDRYLGDIPVLDGARELLADLRGRDLAVVLATSGKPEHVDHYLDLLDAHGLERVTAEDAAQSKPAPDLVASALERMSTDSAVMVGDSVWDVRSAAEAGVQTACVRTGGCGAAELTDVGAVAVYDDLDALREALL